MGKEISREEFQSVFGLGSKVLKRWGRDAYESCAPVDVLDFFCCAGGMSLGFAVLKDCFKVIGGIDINPVSLTAYHQNYQVPTLLRLVNVWKNGTGTKSK